MSEDKVISMEDFRKTERKLNNKNYEEDEGAYEGIYTSVKLVAEGYADSGELYAIVEQGSYSDEGGRDEAMNGIVIPADALKDIIAELSHCADLIDEIREK